jgi:2-amino-4-hydroxy-6-hydroxymethyldihydropteridine diphosphokinase
MTPVRQAFVGVGSNQGDRCATIRGALDALRALAAVPLVEPSSVYETDPVGYLEQPPFLNAVFALETTLTPEALLAALSAIEERYGRTRTIRWGPRTLDLDLLAFEGEVRETEFLRLPHPHLLEREFVTVPLTELLAQARFQRPCWKTLRAQLAATRSSPGVRLFPACRLAGVATLAGARRKGA